MNCSSCGAQLPEGITTCPTCNPYASDIEAIPYQPAAPASFDSALPQKPSIERYSRLSEKAQAYPKPPPQRQTARYAMVGGTVLLVLILIGAGVFAFFTTHRVPGNNSSSAVVATATPTTSPNPYPPYSGTLLIDDPLRDNSLGLMQGYHWDNDDDNGTTNTGHCHFVGNSYHVSVISIQGPYFIYCPVGGTNLSNFTYEVQMTITEGNYGGIIFRQAVHARFYYFYIGQDGTYGFALSAGSQEQVLASGSSAAIHTGLNQPNTLAVVANGSKMDLYVNHQLINSVTDTTYTIGRIGMIVVEEDGHAVDTIFSDARVWIF